jgi:hypothetical protein
MEEEKQEKKSLEDFLNKTQFSNETIASIFRELVANHPGESERQHTVRAAIMMWMRKYPNEMALFEKKMQKSRELQANDMAADMKQDQRHLFRIPESLWNRITMVVKDPPFLTQSNPMTKEEEEEFTWFIREFPQFVVAKIY